MMVASGKHSAGTCPPAGLLFSEEKALPSSGTQLCSRGNGWVSNRAARGRSACVSSRLERKLGSGLHLRSPQASSGSRSHSRSLPGAGGCRADQIVGLWPGCPALTSAPSHLLETRGLCPNQPPEPWDAGPHLAARTP